MTSPSFNRKKTEREIIAEDVNVLSITFIFDFFRGFK